LSCLDYCVVELESITRHTPSSEPTRASNHDRFRKLECSPVHEQAGL